MRFFTSFLLPVILGFIKIFCGSNKCLKFTYNILSYFVGVFTFL
jgi:hypothetical protein